MTDYSQPLTVKTTHPRDRRWEREIRAKEEAKIDTAIAEYRRREQLAVYSVTERGMELLERGET